MSYLIEFDPIFQDKEQLSEIYLMSMNFYAENYLRTKNLVSENLLRYKYRISSYSFLPWIVSSP